MSSLFMADQALNVVNKVRYFGHIIRIDLSGDDYVQHQCCSLWCSCSKAKMKKRQVAFNDSIRILLKLPRQTSASHMFVTRNVPTFHAVLRNLCTNVCVN